MAHVYADTRTSEDTTSREGVESSKKMSIFGKESNVVSRWSLEVSVKRFILCKKRKGKRNEKHAKRNSQDQPVATLVFDLLHDFFIKPKGGKKNVLTFIPKSKVLKYYEDYVSYIFYNANTNYNENSVFQSRRLYKVVTPLLSPPADLNLLRSS